ncbi:hypothetical protein ABTK11_22230, partial [Acinetobacter baumannii]
MDASTSARPAAPPLSTDSDIHRTIRSEARQAAIRRVQEKIDALGVDHIYYQFVSVTGRVMGKSAPAVH